MTKITWLGHASWLIESDQHRVLLDPFLTGNPAASAKPDDFDDVSHILLSHGHFDHVGDTAEIANRAGATVVTNFEISLWLTNNHGVKNTVGMNIGGNTTLPIGNVKMVPAVHSSGLPDGSYGGVAAGFVLTVHSKRIYFACDTSLYSDMRLYAHKVDLAVLPIGDLFTMGVDDSVEAVKMIEPKQVLPAHYNTMPPIEQDAQAWADRVKKETIAAPTVLNVGESIDLSH